MIRNTGIIFAVAVVLAAGVYFLDVRHHSSATSGNNVSKPTFAITADNVKSVEFQHTGASMTFDRRSDGWYLTAPLSTRADQPRVTYLVGQIVAMQTRRVISATPDRFASFGLEHPRITVDFKMNDDTSHSLRIGAADFSETSLYALVDGSSSNISMVSDPILEAADWSADDFRDHTVLDLPLAEATAVDLKNKSGEVEAINNDSSWNILKPSKVPADPWAIRSLLDTVRLERISKFVPEAGGRFPSDLSKYGLTNPAIELRVTVANASSASRTATLQIGKKEGNEYYARDTSRPFLFTISEGLYNSLNSQDFKKLQQSEDSQQSIQP